MALVAMSSFTPSLSFAQKAFSPKIKTPDTSKELKKEEKSTEVEEVEEKEPEALPDAGTGIRGPGLSPCASPRSRPGCPTLNR